MLTYNLKGVTLISDNRINDRSKNAVRMRNLCFALIAFYFIKIMN